MSGPQWRPGLLYEAEGDELTCVLCPHRCRLRDGEVGLCRVRRRTGRDMQTATFASSVNHVGRIERKPLYHFRPGSRCVTLAAPGCTFLCGYCINSGLSQYGRPAGDAWTAASVDPAAVVAQAAALDGVVALSYTEPALAIELTLALAAAGRDRGVEVVWKSNGFLTPEAVRVVAPALAAVCVDIKAADDDRHRRLTGGALAPVLQTVHELHDHGVWIEIATPLIPGTSDDPESLAAIAGLIANLDPEIPWHLLRFTPTFRMTRPDPTPPAALAAAVDIGRQAGLRHVYVERALGAAGRATACPSCGHTVVRRQVWSTVRSELVAGACPTCARRVAGRW